MTDTVVKRPQKIVKQGDVVAQSTELLDVIEGGGVAVLPLDVAYAIVGNSEESIRRIFTAKNRSYEKPSGMFSNFDLLEEIQIMEDWKKDIVRAVIFDNDLPFSTVAPFRTDHPMFKNVAPFVLQNSSKLGTLDMLLNAGVFHNEMTRQSLGRGMPVFGSSANTSLQGSKYRLEDIEEPVRAAGDMLVDGGLSKYHNDEGLSSSIIDFTTFKTVRIGVCYDKLCDIFLKFDIDLKKNGMA
jgi:tRNA A37 threonylcarbamoyladenosine synthetase subunit TsaC/SUA5/YrdC